jgi:hypothetical protein
MFAAHMIRRAFGVVAIGLVAANACWGQPIFQPATTVQLPVFGVAINADGVLTAHKFEDPDLDRFLRRVQAAQQRLPANLFAESGARKISLARLDRAIDKALANGASLDDTIAHLAGLQRVEYVVADPVAHDIILVGPAEGWIVDGAGRAVGVRSGRPVILLEDLLVALRAYAPDRPESWVGCSIGPTADGLQRLEEFRRTVPARVPEGAEMELAAHWIQGARDALGLASVIVFGVEPATHMAAVLVEADYRMKLIAIGLEPPPIDMPTYFGELRGGDNDFQRWWFTPDYQCARISPDQLVLHLVGQGVRLGTEDYAMDAGGMRPINRQPSRAARLYAESFTRRYADIAASSPVFAQLRAMIDLLIAAAFMEKFDLYDRAGWRPRVLLDDARLSAATRAAPTQAPCLANAAWKGRRLVAPAGGGICILAGQALQPENLLPPETGDAKPPPTIDYPDDPDVWWWD